MDGGDKGWRERFPWGIFKSQMYENGWFSVSKVYLGKCRVLFLYEPRRTDGW